MSSCFLLEVTTVILAGRDTVWLPSIIFSACALFSCFVTLTLPDTSNRNLLATVFEAEKLYSEAVPNVFGSLINRLTL